MSKIILIIEDEIDVADVIMFRLEAKGYKVIAAVNGKDGIEAAKVHFPNLILLDFSLPDMKAPAIVKGIKSNESLKGIPVILMTASVGNIDEKARKCEAVEYVIKPVMLQELYDKIEKHIGL